jgi:succinoglycan biosynthesis protein ExoM
MSPTPPLRIAIGVITRRRPRELGRLLGSLAALRVPEGVRVEVVVVENDDAPGSGARLDAGAIAVRHAFEPVAGIPQARNRVLDLAADQSDRIVFVDDDETVEPDLLERLLATERATGADAVAGPALPAFPPDAPAWVARSRAYEPVRHATGARIPHAFTNNAMFRSELVRDGSLRFDESMRFTGGSDRDFFARLAGRGHAIAWADDAVTHEWYPRERLTRRWLFRRSMRLGTVAMRTEGLRGARGRATVLWRALRFAARGLVRLARHPGDPAVGTALASWDFGRTVGLLRAAAGWRYDEYKTR